jgi:DNA-binding MarR family transcriptional regulator
VAEPLADELIQQINGIRRVVRRRLRTGITLPLTPSQVDVLRVVEETPGIGVAAAARALHLAGNSVSTVVNQLVTAGYLRRQPDPADGRAVRLRLTRSATARLAVWRTERVRLVDAGLAQLSARDRAAIARAIPALRALAETLGGAG